MPKCASCGGTGWQWFARSWFKSDGYRRESCHTCGGSGQSSYRDVSEFIRWQARLRADSPPAPPAARAPRGRGRG